jgi:hypothetical protein
MKDCEKGEEGCSQIGAAAGRGRMSIELSDGDAVSQKVDVEAA